MTSSFLHLIFHFCSCQIISLTQRVQNVLCFCLTVSILNWNWNCQKFLLRQLWVSGPLFSVFPNKSYILQCKLFLETFFLPMSYKDFSEVLGAAYYWNIFPKIKVGKTSKYSTHHAINIFEPKRIGKRTYPKHRTKINITHRNKIDSSITINSSLAWQLAKRIKVKGQLLPLTSQQFYKV